MAATSSHRVLKGVLVALSIVGLLLVVWGFFIHRVSVYAMEVRMTQDLKVPVERGRELDFHLTQIKDLGDVPGYFGCLILVLAVIAMWTAWRPGRLLKPQP